MIIPLSESLKYWRIDRPDEWKIDDFIREANKLETENEMLKQKVSNYQQIIKSLGEKK